MPDDDFTSSGPDEMYEALDLARHDDFVWEPSDEELRTIWAQQLHVPLADEIRETMGPVMGHACAEVARSVTPAIHNLADFVSHPSPPAGLLQLLKAYARASADHPVRPLPRKVSRAIYWVTIAQARRMGHQITSLDEVSMERGIHWARQQTWLDETTRRLFEL